MSSMHQQHTPGQAEEERERKKTEERGEGKKKGKDVVDKERWQKGERKKRRDGEDAEQGSWSDEVNRKGEKEKRQEGVKGNEIQKIEKDRMVPSGPVEEGFESCHMVQIFVTVDGARTSTVEMAMSDKVDDIVKRFPIGDQDQDVNVTSGGRILRGSDKLRSCKLRSCGVRDGSTVQVTSRAGRRKTQGQEEQA